MNDHPELKDLANQYVDLWQEHVSRLSQDQETAELMAKTMALMTSGTAAFAKTLSKEAQSTPINATGEETKQDANNVNSEERPPSSGAQASPVSSERSDVDVAELLERIATLEKRVSELEQTGHPPRNSKVRRRK